LRFKSVILSALFTFAKKELGHLSVISVVDKKGRNVFINHRDHRAHREGILVTEKVNNAVVSGHDPKNANFFFAPSVFWVYNKRCVVSNPKARCIMSSRKAKAAEFVGEEYAIMVTGRNVHVTEAMKQYALEKIGKIERFGLRLIDVQVIMDIQKLEHRVDIILKVDHIKIKSQALSENMYASIDKAIDKMQNQIRRYHDRIRDHQGKHPQTVDMNVNVWSNALEAELSDVNEEIEGESQRRAIDSYGSHKIVQKDTIPLKVLTKEEAIMKMELSGDVFLIFRQEEDRKLKVIYRRRDGNYGIIETEAQ